MAAISTLMVNELPLRTDRLEEDQTPTAHRAVTRMASPSTLMDSSHHRFANDQQRQTTPDQRSGYASSNTSPLRLTTENLQKAARAQDSPDVMDIDADQDEGDGSDNETEPGDSNSMSRKKKGQRFFCTGYPPCNLSFTRSEHLARHIRKHTGERPFQCHCNRRFSRLDNLRQHAQTVHVNEEIPTDSLAATGTRFQRQIRTDRIRPTGRPRSGTMSSTGTHSRGHSRNLSASSIGSTSSNFSTSTVDARRRQPPLLMASEVRPKLGLDLPRTPPQQFATYTTLSPSDLKTPGSATFSATPGSPAFGAATASPLASVSRASVYAGTRLPARRLSVPTAPNVYAPGFRTPTHSFSNPGGPPGGTLSPEISTVPSPTSSTFSHTPTLDSSSGEDWRRRTWHPSSYLGLNTNYNRPATSGLTYSQTPDAPQPAFAPNATAAAGQAPRLPGIESFDHVQQRPSTPPRTNSTGFLGESTRPPPLTPLAGHRRHVSADVSRYNVQPYTHDRAARLGPTSSWMNDSMTPPYQAGARLRTQMPEPLNSQLTSHGQTSTQTLAASPSIPSDARGKLGPSAFANPTLHHPSTPVTRVSPEDSGSSEGVATPGTSGGDVNPTIMPTSGVLDAQHMPITLENGPNPCIQTPTILPPLSVATHDHSRRDLHIHGNDLQQLNRLDALAAVATGSGDGGNRR